MEQTSFDVQNHSSLYFSHGYNHGARWMTYFYQLQLLTSAGTKSVLEIGHGHGWMGRIIKDYDIEWKSVDIDPELSPDYVAEVGSLPIPDNSFDIVCAFEVLEHRPFDEFVDNLKEMGRVARHQVIISLPDHRRTLINFSLKIPFIPILSLLVKIPSFTTHKFNGQHYWEIGKKGYPPHRIKEKVRKSGLILERSFVPRDTPMNHYFVMRKN